MLVLGAINWFGNRSYNLTILFEVQVVQDGIHSLMNHALTSDHSPGSIRIQLAGSFKVTSSLSTLALLLQDIVM